MELKSLFKVVFNSGADYDGGHSYQDTGWMQIPNKSIAAIFYKLSGNDCLCLWGYSSYFHMVEVTCDLSGKDRGIHRIQCAHIMGRKGDEVIDYRIELFKKNEIGNITKHIYTTIDPFITGLNKANWKPLLT